MRKNITIILAITLLIGAFLLANYFITNKKQQKPTIEKIIKTVFVDEVNNTTIPIIITANGTVEAKHKIELFSEVQGILTNTGKVFKPGTTFQKGETIVNINSDEFYANLQAQKSNLYNIITSVMPDLKLDFPNNYEAWQQYLQNFDIHKPTSKLPVFLSDKEKYFISGKGVLTSYYNVKNLEVKLSKYNLKAPFSGIVTDAMVTQGTLVRSGQKLGEFINPTVYEVGVSVKSAYKDLLQLGKEVTVYNLEKTANYTGKVVRINGKVDAATQTITAYIEVLAPSLKEGEYVEVALQTKSEENAVEIARNLLVDNSKLYIVKDSVLDLINVNVLFENKNTIVINGLENGTKLVSKPIPGAHVGMLVKIYNTNKTQ
jgi:multidrug efflux pump subunit AcrA (membrane-fusion protein)